MEEARQGIEAQVLARAAKDPEFRQRLKEHPKRTIEQEFGLAIPQDVEVAVLEETPQKVYLILPLAPAQRGQELTDRQLESVAGGWTGDTAQCGTCDAEFTCAGQFTCDLVMCSSA